MFIYQTQTQGLTLLPTEFSPSGTEILIDSDPVHPEEGYKMKASAIAGWIQKLRT